MVLGRHPQLVHIPLNQPQASKRHARIRRDKRGWQIQDLNSSCGTNINQVRLLPFKWHQIDYGDQIDIGGIDYYVARDG